MQFPLLLVLLGFDQLFRLITTFFVAEWILLLYFCIVRVRGWFIFKTSNFLNYLKIQLFLQVSERGGEFRLQIV